MAWLQKRGDKYHISFFHDGKHYSRSLKTDNERKANGAKSRLEENLADVERGRMEVPTGADLLTFLLSDGKLEQKPKLEKAITLVELFDHYLTGHPEGAKEPTTRYTEKIHMGHLKRLLGEGTQLAAIKPETLQAYAQTRSKEKSKFRQGISHTTIRKELATLSAIWSKWGITQGLVKTPPPTKGLIYNKGKQKLPFQTWDQIMRRIKRGDLAKTDITAMWESLFLNKEEITQLLDFVASTPAEPFVHPMFVFAAYTGARRSEMIRSQVDDIDFESGMVMIREKKKDRSKDMTFRSVPMSGLLAEVMRKWLNEYPGGQFTFSETAGVPLTMQNATKYFRLVLKDSKWKVLSGYHALRHSFCSNLAASSIDQRIIDSFMGHQSEAMRMRYRHLFPERQKEAIKFVFG